MVLNGNSSENRAFSDSFRAFVTTSCLDNVLRRLTDQPSGANATGSD